jgi:hypothetical protein
MTDGGGGMKEEWLFPNAVVPVDVETTVALVAEIHRLIDVVGGMALAKPTPAEYAMGYAEGFNDACKPKQGEPVGRFAKFTDGVWRPVTDYSAGVPLYTHPQQRTWARLTDREIEECWDGDLSPYQMQCIREIESRLREKNHA